MSIFKHILWSTQAWVSVGSAGPQTVPTDTAPRRVCVCIPAALHLELSDLSICHPCKNIILHHYGLIFISPWFWDPFTPIAKLVSSFVNYLFKCSVSGWQKVRQNGGPDFDWFIVFYIFSRRLLLDIYSAGDW